jgi:hypothetical protein
MTKSERKELEKLYTFKRLGADDIVARSLATLVRSARTQASRNAIVAQADVLEVSDHPEWLDTLAMMGV